MTVRVTVTLGDTVRVVTQNAIGPRGVPGEVSAAQLAVETAARIAADLLLIPLVQRAVANGVATLGADTKIPLAQLPAITISDYLGTVASQAAMLALVGQRGDWAIRSDLGSSWIIIGDDPTQLANWKAIATPAAPVLSVNGRIGAVTGLAEAADLAALVTLGTTQIITGAKTFDNDIVMTEATARKLTIGTQTFVYGGLTLTRYGWTFGSDVNSTRAYLSAYGGIRMFTGLNTALSDREVFTILGGAPGVTDGTEGNIGINHANPSSAMLVITNRGAGGVLLQEWRSNPTTPILKVTAAGDLDFVATGRGPIVVSPGGNPFRIGVTDGGALTTVAA